MNCLAQKPCAARYPETSHFLAMTPPATFSPAATDAISGGALSAATLLYVYNQLKLRSISYYLFVGLLFASIQTQAISCPAHTNKAGYYEFKECVPHKTPIEDKSGVKPKTAEEKSVRKAADYFIRLEMSHLMSQSDYEGEVHFAPMVKKYLNMSAKAWRDATDAPYTSVCNKVMLTQWRVTSPKKYKFDYEVLVALSPGWEKLSKLDLHPTTLKANYQFDWIDGQWKVSQAQFSPHQRFTLLRDAMTRVKNDIHFTRELELNAPIKHKKSLAENQKLAEEKYDLMQEANRKVCKPFESK